LKVRVMHYVNQFFAGIGGEDRAGVAVDSFKGAIGPGKRLQELLGDNAEIVVTVYCGDNFFNEQQDEALASILKIAKDNDVKLVAAGPAFTSGRYGCACAEVCHSLSNSLDIGCVTGMHPDNPGLDIYRDYKDAKVFCLPTERDVKGMADALSKMSEFALKLATGAAIGPAAEEGYLPRGFRMCEVADKIGAERAVDMLLAQLNGCPFVTEIPNVSTELVPVAPRMTNFTKARLALISTTGVVPEGNPDKFKIFANTEWRKYSIGDIDSMTESKWDVVHGGYETTAMRNNPNYGVPVDACRALEKEGAFKGLYPYYYATVGVVAKIPAMEAIGKAIAQDMKTEGIDAALMVST